MGSDEFGTQPEGLTPYNRAHIRDLLEEESKGAKKGTEKRAERGAESGPWGQER